MRSADSTTIGMFRANRHPAFPWLRLLLPVLLVTAAASAPAFSQQVDPSCAAVPQGAPRELRSGQCVRSTIDAADPKDDADNHYEDWNLSLAAGEAVQIDMDALAGEPLSDAATAAGETPPFGFDTYLELRRSGADDVIAFNDDREDSVNSTIRFTAAEAGTYVIRARPLFLGSGGYILRVAAPPAPTISRPLVVGRNMVPPVISGGITFQFRLFTFEGRAGERVRLNLSREGTGFGTNMRLVGPEGQPLAMVGEMSESLGIAAILPSAGTYRVEIRLHDFGGGAQSPVLDFERLAVVPARAPRAVRVGEAVDGEITFASPASPDPFGGGPMFGDLYALRLTGGQAVTVTLESTAFDPALDAGAMSPIGFAAALADDDGGGGLNSKLVLRPESSGTVILRVRSLGNRTGPYRLRVAPGEVAPPAE
jgi:Bacterial pre-peptidase C-terminal domain